MNEVLKAAVVELEALKGSKEWAEMAGRETPVEGRVFWMLALMTGVLIDIADSLDHLAQAK